ncbi:hypothetical protein ApDm4_2685 [Acetobacter pomorum]|nr:hypothetical protein ApDm4_2685 [Acetobacter pomorum]
MAAPYCADIWLKNRLRAGAKCGSVRNREKIYLIMAQARAEAADFSFRFA